MTAAKQLAVRVDVDTNIGLREGVPRLLELFRSYSTRASFFVSFGPDNSGKALRRIWRPSFILKMLRTNPFRLYGLRTMLSGTLLPATPIGEGAPELLRAIIAEGHELGIHGYDHVRWQDCLEKMAEVGIEAELSQSVGAYKRIIGTAPKSSAAPGWRCTPSSLAVQETFHFVYASDVRGTCPFLPVNDGGVLETPQIPTTLPTMDELIGREGEINELLLRSLKEGLNVHTIHAEVEGRSYLALFEGFLAGVRRENLETVTLGEAAQDLLRKGLDSLPRLRVTKGSVPGRSGWIACQGAA